MAFPPPQISDRIYKYVIQGKYDITQTKPLIPPPTIDTLKRQEQGQYTTRGLAPFGTMTAIHLNMGAIVWQVPLGEDPKFEKMV